MLGRTEGLYPDENSVEQALHDLILSHKGLSYIFTSSQNLDRLVSIYRAARHSGKTLVIDLYTAFVLDKLSIISPIILSLTGKASGCCTLTTTHRNWRM